MTFDEWWEAANYSSEDAWVKDVAQAAWDAGACAVERRETAQMDSVEREIAANEARDRASGGQGA